MLITDMIIVFIIYVICMVLFINIDIHIKKDIKRIDDSNTNVHYFVVGCMSFVTLATIIFESIWFCLLIGIPV